MHLEHGQMSQRGQSRTRQHISADTVRTGEHNLIYSVYIIEIWTRDFCLFLILLRNKWTGFLWCKKACVLNCFSPFWDWHKNLNIWRLIAKNENILKQSGSLENLVNVNSTKFLGRIVKSGDGQWTGRDPVGGVILSPAISWYVMSQCVMSFSCHVMALDSYIVKFYWIAGLINKAVGIKMSWQYKVSAWWHGVA